MEFFVGTLTREGGAGVLRCMLRGNGIQLKERLFLTDPNYLIRMGSRIFCVSSDAEDPMKGCVNEILPEGKMKRIARQATAGSGPCFLCPSPDGRFLYCANYGTGSIAVFPLENGLGPRIQLLQHAGHGPHPIRQAGPHVHQVLFIPHTQYLCACDLGTDCIAVYRAEEHTGLLSPHSSVYLHGGPRHLVFLNETQGYVCHELSNEVTALHIEDGVLTPAQTLGTLPEAIPNTAGAIRLSPNGKKLYVSNRGHGSLAMYDVLSNGSLQARGFLRAGCFPRDFVILEDGRLLLADQRSGIRLIDPQGRETAFLPHAGAVCVCL